MVDSAGYGLLLPEQSIEQTHRELQEYLDALVEERMPPEVMMHPQIIDGDVASVIVDTAVAEAVDLIVMSTHGHTGFSRWYLGSVTEKVLRSAPCPVLVIREVAPISRILITLDGSELSEQALTPGLEIAECFDGKVTLLRVEHPDDIDRKFIADLDKAKKGLGALVQGDYYHRVENYLWRIAKQKQHWVSKEIQIAAVTGSVAENILRTIEAEEIDLVVMATHGRSGLRRWVYGSITEKVLRSANCAMLIIRPPLEKLN
jgi:nucleotide-binding universal stress UspA family protein